jgi:hypothetical protein
MLSPDCPLMCIRIIYYALYRIFPFETSSDEIVSDGSEVEIFENHISGGEKSNGSDLEKAPAEV